MEEYSPSTVPPKRTCKILRRSVFLFLQNYQFFTSAAAILVFPFAASTLLAQSLINQPSSSPLLLEIHSRLKSLFYAAGFPVPSEFTTILNWKLSQTISTSFLILPFNLSFFLLAKGSIIQELRNSNRAMISVYLPLVKTHLWNFLLILSTNATFFSIIFFVFNILDALGLQNSNLLLIISAAAAVLYSIMLANAVIICNLALIISGSEMKGGYMAILRACVLIKGRSATAMSLLVAINIALAALEALFQYRILRAYYHSETSFSCLAYESMLIAYMYAIVLVLDTIIGFLFFHSCKSSCLIGEGRYSWEIQAREYDVNAIVSSNYYGVLREGTKLERRWKCQPSPNSRKTTADILDFLLDSNIRLSYEVVNKTQSFDRLKVEAEKCFAQSDKLSTEKEEFAQSLWKVLNSKKEKLRELRDQLAPGHWQEKYRGRGGRTIFRQNSKL